MRHICERFHEGDQAQLNHDWSHRYWENKIHLTENQKTRKFAAWLVQEFEKQVTKAEREGRKPTRKQSSEKPNNRNVNDPWGEVQNYEPATGDVDTRGLL